MSACTTSLRPVSLFGLETGSSSGDRRATASCTMAGMTYLLGLCLLILALWLASEIAGRDLSARAPRDPYRLDRWRKGEKDPDL